MGLRRVLLFLAASTLVFAQGERGTFNGTVTDASGAVLPNATVKAIHTQTNVETVATTTSAGGIVCPICSQVLTDSALRLRGLRR